MLSQRRAGFPPPALPFGPTQLTQSLSLMVKPRMHQENLQLARANPGERLGCKV